MVGIGCARIGPLRGGPPVGTVVGKPANTFSVPLFCRKKRIHFITYHIRSGIFLKKKQHIRDPLVWRCPRIFLNL